MWLEEADGVFDVIKYVLPFYLLIALPLLIVLSSVNPTDASHEFTGYRMQQYDLHGVPHGCRSSSVNLEARSVKTWKTSRHCVLVRMEEMTNDQFREVRARAGALVVVLPNGSVDISDDVIEQMLELEETMLNQDIPVPVYFVEWTSSLQQVLEDVSTNYISDERGGSSAFENLMNTISANGYQISISSSQATAKTDMSIATIHGKLSGYGVEEKLPTIAFVAYYDSFGVAPELSFGADANGSGVAMLLELARLFSHLYSNPKMHAKYNILFLLTGAGKINYQGSKKYLEDNLDAVETSLISDASYVLCFDSVGKTDQLYLHVSKPPKDGTPGSKLLNELQNVVKSLHPNVDFVSIHKKINLADDMLSWEHEKYSIRRLPAFTLSSIKSHKNPIRSSILDTRDKIEVSNLVRNTKIVAEAIARQIYNFSSGKVFSDKLGVEPESVKSWIDFLSSRPRSVQLLADKQNPVVETLTEAMSRYLKEVKVTYQVPDKRDPEFVFYDVTKANVNVYSVKPAVFDLFLTVAISLYLGLVYLLIQNFWYIYQGMTNLTSSKKTKTW